MRVEKNGFVLHLEGTWMEISNKYGVLEHGDVVVDSVASPEKYAKKKLNKFISVHSIFEESNPTCIKRVAHDSGTGEYIQLQAVLQVGWDCWTVQRFDNELVYMGEIWPGCKYPDEVLGWMRENYEIESGLPAYVYRNYQLADCTRGGISAHTSELYVLSEHKGPSEPEDIRQCVYIEGRKTCGEQYICSKPIYFRKLWYMAGGNFLYTSDNRFKEITKSKYPIPIHDRYEGR